MSFAKMDGRAGEPSAHESVTQIRSNVNRNNDVRVPPHRLAIIFWNARRVTPLRALSL